MNIHACDMDTGASLWLRKLREVGQTNRTSRQPELALVCYTEVLLDNSFSAPVADAGANADGVKGNDVPLVRLGVLAVASSSANSDGPKVVAVNPPMRPDVQLASVLGTDKSFGVSLNAEDCPTSAPKVREAEILEW